MGFVMQQRILVVFLVSSIFTALIISLIAGQYANNVAIFKNVLLSLYFFLSIWILVGRLGNYGLALLFSLILIPILGMFHSFWVFTAILIFLSLIVLYDVRNLGWSVKLRMCLNASIILLTSIILALVGISGMGQRYGDLWIDYRILNARLHIDTLFHVACANMIKNYHAISTGLHGLPFMGYHAFSHFLYGSVSNILKVDTYQVYGYTTFIVFIPLLFLSCLSFAEELVPSRTRSSLYISFVLLVSIFIGFLGRDVFVTYGLLWNSYFISESYLISLIMLCAFLSYVLSAVNRPGFFLSLLFLILLSASKISVGFMGLIVLIICELSWGGDLKDLSGTKKPVQALISTLKRRLWSKSLLKIAIYIFLFAYGASFFIGAQNNWQFDFLYFATTYLKPSVTDQLGGLGSLIVFFFTHYFFVMSSILLLVMYFFLNRNSFGRLRKMFLFLIIVTLAGFFPLCIPLAGGGGYYFSNISMFLAIPIMLSCKNYISKEAFRSNLRGIAVVTTIIVLFGMYGSLNYGIPYLMREISTVEKQKDYIIDSSAIAPYISQLKAIEANNSLEKYLVYIPKQETDFWSDSDPISTKRAFMIPAVSGRPALFGLPFGDAKGGYYGYKNYSETLFDEARLDKISHERLCEETRRLGFEGYIVVSAASYERCECKIPAL